MNARLLTWQTYAFKSQCTICHQSRLEICYLAQLMLNFFVFFCDFDGQKNPLNAVMTFRCTELCSKGMLVAQSTSHFLQPHVRNPRNWRSHFMELVNSIVETFLSLLGENLVSFTISILEKSKETLQPGKIDSKHKRNLICKFLHFSLCKLVSSNLTQKY